MLSEQITLSYNPLVSHTTILLFIGTDFQTHARPGSGGSGGDRITVENSICRIKQYARMTEMYGGTEDELNAELNIVAGLVNLHLMMTLQSGSHKMRKRFLG